MHLLGTSLISLLVIGAPIGIALAGATILIVLADPIMTPKALFRSYFSFLSSYTLMAIPFFIYAGFLMERTGLIAKLFRFADALIGWLPGGFAYATLLAAVMFGAISGSSTAMAAAMGVIAYPEMIRRGYPIWMAAGIIACGGGIALLIPPSITLILFGIITEESIIALFFAGVVPGVMLALSDAVIIVAISFYMRLPAGTFEVRGLLRALYEAWPALLMPVIILGGLYGGLFTPTEAGAAACAYSIIYGMLSQGKTFFGGVDGDHPARSQSDRDRFLCPRLRRRLPVPARKQGLATGRRELGQHARPVAAWFPGHAAGGDAVPVDVPDRRRDTGADRADLLPGRPDTGR